ncbi:hypothetical protein NAP1_04345 [Erythrobacter sp. NAP1]|uniref:hypothetical protein n=1 Tax=Erythrobacter sp. NAP1 TaxID=237727 RepID=UPI000068699F|nr:hypothetical protein [Erythrobacter sp. NAP1]EAQ29975.1 hypothetical protein NAP1_04345 [Erythrobacter sp. NAP1]
MATQLFAPDPIDFFDPVPYSLVEYQGHMIVGGIWFVAALVAFFATKGSRLHIRAGQVCIASVLLIGVTALVMLAREFIAPLALNAVTSSYAVITAWLALKPSSANVRSAEVALSVIEVAAVAAFLAIALPNVMSGLVPPIGPVVVLLVPLILLGGDINWHLRQHDRARLRVGRHLARMIWAFVIVLRAPLVEFETAGFYELPDPLLVAGPVLLGAVMLFYAQYRFAGPTRGSQKPQAV